MKRYTADTLPASAAYIGSTEGPDRISTQVLDLIDDTTAPAYIQDPDGTRHFYELCPQDFQPRAYSNEASFL
jgi:hypothetical protein